MDALAQLKASLSSRYEVEREIGAGGMATVYLARDIRHDRHVALKLLNPELGAVLGVERFLSEIRVTANLQHPNLLPLFDSGEAEGLLYYVMPFVDGESLRSRLDREKQLPVEEAIRVSVAIANALEYAHSHGVIHRDLKPENVLMQSGQPVIADFGIALAVSKAGGNRITQTGLSLGTPHYMSPEQATGDRVIDGRSDIYSLGAVTYEMLTGEPPHTGNTSQAIIARVLTDRPRPMRTSRAAIPEHVEAAVMHALEKLPADRFSSAHEFAEALQGRGLAGVTEASTVQRRAAQPAGWHDRLRDPVTIGLAALAVAAVGFAAARGRTAAPSAAVVRYVMATPDSSRPLDNYPWPAAISPDGKTIAYTVASAAGPQLMVLRTDQLDARPIGGAAPAFQVMFSPDGQWIGYESDKFRKVRLDGSAPIAVGDASAVNGADWTVLDEIVVGSEGTTRGLSKMPAAGGDLVEFVKPDKSKGETDYLWPIAFPDGKRVAFAVWSGSLATARMATVSIDGGEVSLLGIRGIRPLAVIGRILVYLQADGSVMGVTLDGSGKKLAGKPAPVLDPVPVVAGNNGNSGVFVSSGGALISSRGGTKSHMAWLAKDKPAVPLTEDVREYTEARLSPDGRRVAVVVYDHDKSDVWIYDLDTRTLSRLSSVPAAASPAWTPDGSHVVYVGLGDKERFAIWSQAADGGSPPEKLVDTNALTRSVIVAPDGKSLITGAYSDNSWNLFRVPLDSTHAEKPYMTNAFNENGPRFSPDGRWVALQTDESGRAEVYLRSYPNPAARVQISAGGGNQPAWSPDGRTVFYRSGGNIIAARLSTTPNMRVIARDTAFSNATSLVRGDATAGGIDVAKDGRFLGLVSSKEDFQLVAVPNWIAELKQRMGENAKR